MNDSPPPPYESLSGVDGIFTAGSIENLPVGICVYGPDRRLVAANAAYHASVSLPPGNLRPGTLLTDNIRLIAYRGAFGPGDPEAQVAERVAMDRSRRHRRRRRRDDGRVFDLMFEPMPDGGWVVCSIETTALIKASEESREHAWKMEMALSLLRSGVALFGPDDRLMLRNRRFEELLSLPPDTLRPGLLYADMLGMLAARGEYGNIDGEHYIASQVGADRSRSRGSRRVRPNGDVLDMAADPLPGGGWMITVHDITPLARAEDEANRRAAVLDGILANIPHGVCVYGPDRRVTMFNRAYTEIMKGAPLAVGDTLEEVVRRRAAAGEYGPGAGEQVVDQQMAFDIAAPQARRRRRPNGTGIDIRTAPLPDGGHISVVTDITPLVQAEAEASRRAAVLDSMLSHIRHGIILYDAERRVVAANRVAEQLLGHPPGLLVPGRAQSEILSDMLARGEFGAGPQATQTAQEFLSRDRVVSSWHQRTTREGRALEVRSDPIPGGGYIITYTDVTEARAAERALRSAKDAAEAASLAKSRFLATMSHELRTPLNAVIGFSDALSRDPRGADPAQVMEFSQAINEAGRHLLSLINDILDVARIEAGRFELASDRVDVGRLAAASARLVGPNARASQVSIVTDLPPDLPRIVADERRMKQVLLNLLSNAVKFTPAGGSATLAARRDPGGDLVLTVTDTGIGIPEEDLERVFEPFTQLDAGLDRRFQGTGLGLYMSRALVAAHDGTLHLESGRGRGTVAVVRLPRERIAAATLPETT